MAGHANGTRRDGLSRHERELAQLQAEALDKSLSPAERGRAATDLARLQGTLPGPVAAARGAAVAEMRAVPLCFSEIARLIGLSARAGRVHQILEAHRARTASDA